MKNIRIQKLSESDIHFITVGSESLSITAIEAWSLLKILKDMEKELIEEIEGCE